MGCVVRLDGASEESDSLFDRQGVLYAEYAAAAALKAVEVGAASQCFTQIACECADIGAFAACHTDLGAWQSQSGVVRHIYPA